jgi:hypothetical protein
VRHVRHRLGGQLDAPWKQSLLEGDIHLGKAAGFGCVYHSGNFSQHPAHQPPSQAGQNRERDFAASEILPLPDVLVDRHHHVEAGFFRNSEQIAGSSGWPNRAPGLPQPHGR